LAFNLSNVFILLRKYNLELYMTATELTESTERGVWGGKSFSVFSVVNLLCHDPFITLDQNKLKSFIILIGSIL